MVILGYILFVLVGITLGLVGSGGSILTLPILVYVLKINPATATAYSLFIVGTSALTGGINHAFRKNVDFKTVFLFGIPSLLTAYFTRLMLLPMIPEHIIQIEGFALTKSLLLMLIFSLVMIVASFGMIRTSHLASLADHKKYNYQLAWIFLIGAGVGILTGFIGVGGGFLIIPSLVMLLKTPIKRAVGTSLIIIALNSLTGFAGDLHLGIKFEWNLMLLFSLFAIAGLYIGILLSKKISGETLKKVFGWFVLLMGVYILIMELFFPIIHSF